jgi:hypothetical protein
VDTGKKEKSVLGSIDITEGQFTVGHRVRRGSGLVEDSNRFRGDRPLLEQVVRDGGDSGSVADSS